jgi:signal transduction histidine kinase
MKLFTKIYLAVFLCFLAAVILISYVMSARHIRALQKHIVREQKVVGSFISRDIERGQLESRWPFESLARVSRQDNFLFWWIVDGTGTIHLANDISFIGSRADSYCYFGPVADTTGDGQVILNRPRNYGIFVKSFGAGKNKWTFWLGFRAAEISEARGDVILWVTVLSASALAALAGVLYLTITHFTRPIRSLAEGAARIGRGELGHRVQIRSADELGELARSFNKMAEDLAATTTSIDKLNREVSHRQQAEEALRQRTQRVISHRNVLLKLAKMQKGDLGLALNTITEQAGKTLSVERVSIRLFTEDRSAMVCADSYKLSENIHKGGLRLAVKDFPRYFQALEENRILAANDARTDRRTSELIEKYLQPLGITSMMDVPLRLHGAVIGTVCHGHTGPPRAWTIEEQDFAASLADMVALAMEASERKKVEEMLQALNTDLESTVQQLNLVNRELQDFAYIVSHDLKAPLRGIKSLAGWLASDYADRFDETGREQIKLLSTRVDRMHNLIEGVLQYSRAGRSTEQKQPVNLNELVDEVIDAITPPENITITIKNPLPVIMGEKTRLVQIFQNLLSNAVKFMDKLQGQVQIGCADEGGFWKFSVADNGCGIEEKHFSRIFQLFATLVPRDDFESTGVGLTVAKKIVELYGGRIWVESKLGQGSTFFFTLPKQQKELTDAKQKANIAC